jgi:CRP-like cAMP-binding protein/membrane protein YdbS with pleckstrin-like domain
MIAWGLPPGDVEYVLRDAVSLRELRPREVLFVQGSPVTHIYLLKTGTLYQDRITRNQEGPARVSLRREISPGSLVGHYDLLYGQEHSTRIRALEFCKLVAVNATALNRLLYTFPDLRHRIVPEPVIGRLRTVPLFGQLDPAALCLLAEECKHERLADSSSIYGADDWADRLFVIDEGQVRLRWPSGESTWLGNGMSFGFLDQILENPVLDEPVAYGHTAAAAGTTALFSWPRNGFIDLTDIHPEETGHRLRTARERTIQSVTVFSKFPLPQQRRLIGYMSHYHYPIPHFVMQQGELGDSLWVLMPGSQGVLRALDGMQAMQPTRVYGPNYFSELSLRVEHPLDSTVQAEPGSQWLRLHKQDFQVYLKDTDPKLMDALTLSPAAERYLGRTKIRKRYSWLQQGENLVIFQRRHYIVLIRKLAVSLVLLGLLALGYSLLSRIGWTQWSHLAVALVPALLVAGHFVWNILDYLNDYILVTNQRVAHQEKVLFIAERRKAAFLEQIRNVDVVTSFFGRILNYGAINIQTAATAGSIKFDYVPNPHSLRQIMLEQQTHRLQHYQASTKMVIQNLLQERLGLRLDLPIRVVPEGTGGAESGRKGWRGRIKKWLRSLPSTTGEQPDLIVWRKHWFVLIGKIAMPLSLLFFILMLATGQQFLPDSLHRLAAALDLALALVGLITAAWIAWNVEDWRNDTYEVDNKQLADVEKKPLFFAEQRRTALLSEIENIEFRIPSPIHFLFNFGNVSIQTAATEGEFSFDWVPDPRGVSEELRRRIEAYREQQEAARARRRSEELPDWFEMYDRLGMNAQNAAGNGRTPQP